MNEMNHIEDTLLELIRIPSVTGNEEALVAHLDGVLRSLGCEVSRYPVSSGRDIIVAKRGVSDRWMVAHMDTVPGEVLISVDEHDIFGRGSCDNKGSIAGILQLLVDAPDLACNVLLTVGEEDTLDGALEAKRLGIIQDASRIIVMEPTELRVYSGQRGAVDFKVRAEGIQKHSSLIEGSYESAIHQLLDFLEDLKGAREGGLTAFNIGTISGGVAKNITARYAEAEVIFRPESEEEMNMFLEKINNIESWRVRGAKLSISEVGSFPPVPGSPKVPFFTEAVILGAYAKETLVFGAGSILDAHSETEHVSREQLRALPGELAKLLA